MTFTDPSRNGPMRSVWRSEEHTSELQSRQYLVCRLLLEKKKKRVNTSLLNKSQVVLTIQRAVNLVRERTTVTRMHTRRPAAATRPEGSESVRELVPAKCS